MENVYAMTTGRKLFVIWFHWIIISKNVHTYANLQSADHLAYYFEKRWLLLKGGIRTRKKMLLENLYPRSRREANFKTQPKIFVATYCLMWDWVFDFLLRFLRWLNENCFEVTFASVVEPAAMHRTSKQAVLIK